VEKIKWIKTLPDVWDIRFFRPSGAFIRFVRTHGLRRGLHSFAASRLSPLPGSRFLSASFWSGGETGPAFSGR
jgi:hypothetical protein